MQAKKDVYLTLRLPRDTKTDLRSAAVRRRRSVNWLVQDILERWLLQEKRRRSK